MTDLISKPDSRSCPACGAPLPSDAPEGLCPTCLLQSATAPAESAAPTASAAQGHPRVPPLDQVASAFPQYEILELIGAGGMGAVFKARQPHLDRLVALKVLPQGLAENPSFAERFNREARVLARLNHPNIVTVHDFGRADCFLFLVMEYVDGVNLRQAMQAGRFSPEEALRIVPCLCEALQFAHDEGILHRDIKPENILLDARGRVKIADFGIAKLLGDRKAEVTLTGTGAALGTPQYMAPEQLEHPSEVDHRADIYSLGVVFYEMLTGELPLGRFAPPSQKTPVPPRVDDVVLRTLEKERHRRYQSAAAVKTDVEAASRPTPGAPATPITPPPVIPAPGPRPAPAPGAFGPPSTVPGPTAVRPANRSALCTALSLVLALPTCFLAWPLLNQLSQEASLSLLAYAIVCLLGLTGFSLAIAGIAFGLQALRRLRASPGQREGAFRALFGTLAWPVLLPFVGLVMLMASFAGATGFRLPRWMVAIPILVILALGSLGLLVSRWAWHRIHGARAVPRTPGFRRSGSAWVWAVVILLGLLLLVLAAGFFIPMSVVTISERAPGSAPQPIVTGVAAVPGSADPSAEPSGAAYWENTRPDIALEYTVPAGHVATFALVRSNAAGLHPLHGLQGYVVAGDDRAFEGRALWGITSRGGVFRGEHLWAISIETADGGSGRSGGFPIGNWTLPERGTPRTLGTLETEDRMVFVGSRGTAPSDAESAPESLWVRVQVVPRNFPRDRSFQKMGATCGAGSTNWLEHTLAPSP